MTTRRPIRPCIDEEVAATAERMRAWGTPLTEQQITNLREVIRTRPERDDAKHKVQQELSKRAREVRARGPKPA